MPRKQSVGPHSLPSAVEHHVDDHLESGRVQGADHLSELVDLAAGVAGGRVAVVRCEVADRLVAPVVAQPPLNELRVVDELVDGRLYGRYAEPLQVCHRGRMRHPSVGAAQLLWHVGVQLREALDVHFVEDRVGHRPARTAVVAPVEIRGHEHRARRTRSLSSVRFIRIIGGVTVDRRVPADLTCDRAGVGVEQQLGGVAAGRPRVPRPVHAISVALADPRIW